MLWILTGIFFILAIIGLIYLGTDICAAMLSFFVLLLVLSLIVLCCYNNTSSTALKKIEVLEEKNKLVLEQIEPLVNKYLNYEKETLSEFKIKSENIIALSMFPELRGDKFVKSQIDIVIYNQEKITKLKMKIAGLEAYRLWLFMGVKEVEE